MAIEVKRSGCYETLYDRPLFVNWPITHMCNYNCSYCFGRSPIDKNRFFTYDKFEIAVNNIAKLNRDVYAFTLAGGEPTVHPDFIKIVKLICKTFGSKIDQISIISNGSRDSSYFLELEENVNETAIGLYLSLHMEHARLAHIEDLVKKLSAKFLLGFNLMYHPAKLNEVKAMYDMLCTLRKDDPFSMQLSTLREPPAFDKPDSRYTYPMVMAQEYMQKNWDSISSQGAAVTARHSWYKFNHFTEYLEDGQLYTVRNENRHQLFNKGIKNFKNMACIAGSNILRIEGDGMVKGLVCSQAEAKGNIYDADLSDDFTKAYLVKCAQENCGCAANDCVPKFSDWEEAKVFVEKMNRNLA